MSLIGDGIGPPHLRKSKLRNPGKFCWALESGIQLKESGIPQTIGIQNPSSPGKDRNPVAGIRNPWRGIPDGPFQILLRKS